MYLQACLEKCELAKYKRVMGFEDVVKKEKIFNYTHILSQV